MVAMFAVRLKDTADLDAGQSDLTSVIQRALEPAHVSIWTKTEASRILRAAAAGQAADRRK
jgi:hypothetical protein